MEAGPPIRKHIQVRRGRPQGGGGKCQSPGYISKEKPTGLSHKVGVK